MEQTASKTSKPSVMIKSGVMQESGDFSGMTVKDVRDKFAAKWKIDPGAAAYEGKQQLGEDHVVTPGMTITFHKRQGEKGARRVSELPL